MNNFKFILIKSLCVVIVLSTVGATSSQKTNTKNQEMEMQLDGTQYLLDEFAIAYAAQSLESFFFLEEFVSYVDMNNSDYWSSAIVTVDFQIEALSDLLEETKEVFMTVYPDIDLDENLLIQVYEHLIKGYNSYEFFLETGNKKMLEKANLNFEQADSKLVELAE